jgi:hypothetical protein
MPQNSLAQREGDDRLRTGIDLPGFCQISDKVLEIPIIFDQSIENEPVDVAGSRVLGEDRVEKGGISDGTDEELIDLLDGPETYKNNADSHENKKKDGKNE